MTTDLGPVRATRKKKLCFNLFRFLWNFQDTESELDDDCPTPLAARHSISTVTLTPIGVMKIDDDTDVHSRLLKVPVVYYKYRWTRQEY